MARPADPRKSAAWQRRLGQEQPEKVKLSAAPVFQPLDLLSHRAVVIRFAAGGVMEIPGDRADLVQVAIRVMAGEQQL